MLTLHVEAETFTELMKKAADALGLRINAAAPAPDAAAPAPDAAAPAPSVAPETLGNPHAKRRGRPPLQSVPPTTPTGPLTPPPSTTAPTPTTPTPTTPTPTTPTPTTPTPTTPTPAVPVLKGPPVVETNITYDQVKASLQKLAENKKGEEGTAGLDRVRMLLAKYGYRKVKDVQPEHYQAILTECQANG